MSKYKIILSVCETGSFTATAEKFNYTQPAVSQAIKSIEKDLGFPLFKRTKNGVELMANTKEIISLIREICEAEEKITQIAANITNLNSGYIRIGTAQSIAYHWLPQILNDFSEQYPNVQFEISVDGYRGMLEKLQKNEYDCIFTSDYGINANCTFYPLGTDELMLVTSRDHPLSSKIVISLDDIRNENYILPQDGFNYEVGEILDKYDIRLPTKYQSDDDFAVQKMVEKGFGITILPKLLLHNTPFALCIRPFTEHYIRTLGIATLTKNLISPTIQKFLEHVKNQVLPK